MSLDRYETSTTGPRRLSGRTEQRGSRMGLPTWGGFVFGGIFVAAGTGIMLVGTKVISVNPKGVHAPFWVLTVFGLVFALAGLMVWGMAWQQAAADRRQREAARSHPQEPALADFPWNPLGFAAPRWKRTLSALAGAVFFTLFLSMFNYWAFAANGPWPVKLIVILFDLIAVAIWWEALTRLGRAWKFGGSRLIFEMFPYRVGAPIIIRWQPASGIHRAAKGSITLRCCEEWFERHGSGKNRSTRLVQEENWSATWFLDQARTFQPNEIIELPFQLPPEARPTQLSAERPVFWELEVKLDVPGLDFEETYLVPVY